MAARNRKNAESMADDMTEMSEAVGREAHHRVEGVLIAFDTFNRPFVKVMDQNRAIFEKMLHAMQEESLRFVNRRLEHTSRAIEGSRDCQGVAGLMAVQQEFLMEMARDYAEQTRRFADLLRELTEDGTVGMAEAANATNDAMRHAQRSNIREMEHRAAAE